MAKDPAFLFYSKDWIEGTAEFLPEEKGVLIDLLSHQHQKKDLPSDKRRLARIVGLSLSEFDQIWNGIKHKFIPIATPNGERLINQKLDRLMDERSTKGKKNKIIGTFAYVLKKLSLSKKQYNLLKEEFKIDIFMVNDTEWNTERLTEWCKGRLTFIEDVNVNEDKDESIIKHGVKNKKAIPELFEFMANAKLSCKEANRNYDELEFAIKSKYESWVGAGWKDGNNRPIKNWKLKFNNALPYLKEIKQQQNGSAKESNEQLFSRIDD